MILSKETYRENFIKLVKILMAESGIDESKEMANYLGINYMTYVKIMDRSQYPTVEQAIILCAKGGFSANFLLLNKLPVKLPEVTNLAEIKRLMKKIDEKI